MVLVYLIHEYDFNMAPWLFFNLQIHDIQKGLKNQALNGVLIG